MLRPLVACEFSRSLGCCTALHGRGCNCKFLSMYDRATRIDYKRCVIELEL